uniref:Uncharacterized protein n=1 Tax=Caenorhabditis japonica TaxID=281687 RepID=A0A8R1IRE0_CAEJA
MKPMGIALATIRSKGVYRYLLQQVLKSTSVNKLPLFTPPRTIVNTGNIVRTSVLERGVIDKQRKHVGYSTRSAQEVYLTKKLNTTCTAPGKNPKTWLAVIRPPTEMAIIQAQHTSVQNMSFSPPFLFCA